MKPLSSHWADQTAARIVRTCGEQPVYTVASGITPSGKVHIGNFREVITVDMVARALTAIGKKVRFIYSWDNFDTFRKVPSNLPEQDMLKDNLRRSIARIPDPYGTDDNYARHNTRIFEEELKSVGIEPEFIYQEAEYKKGVYAEQIRYALENKDKIRAILNEHRSTPLADTWEPTSIYCSACGKDDMHFHRYNGEWDYEYHCKNCGLQEVVDLRESGDIKLDWRTDWPMRWAYEKVDFEPGGKDHSSQGGSYDTGKEIVKQLWDREAPQYLQYDFVMIKGQGAKMSSSKGNTIVVSEALKVYSPEMLRWIFAVNRPNHDFSIAFDSDVIKIYDEYDKFERTAIEETEATGGKKWPTLRRTFELSAISDVPPAGSEPAPKRPAFRELCNRLQMCDRDIERTYERFYQDDIPAKDRQAFIERSERALFWLANHAEDRFRYEVNTTPRTDVPLPGKLPEAVDKLKDILQSAEFDSISPEDLNQKIYDDIVRGVGIDAKEFFQAVYQKLICRDQGPRLPSFLKELGRDRVLPLL